MPVELVVFEINVVDYLGDPAQRRVIAQAESLNYRLESAVLAMMRQFCAEHIERNRAFDRFSFRDEDEARASINEPFDEPRGRQPINVQVATSDPPPPLIL